MHTQLQVLQTDEEIQGPFAFQLLSLAKLHCNPQVQPSYLVRKPTASMELLSRVSLGYVM